MSAPILTPLDDVLAVLADRRDAAAAVLGSGSPDEDALDQARDRKRVAEVLIDYFAAGLHIGAAEARTARGKPPC